MKRYISLILTGALLLSLAACGGTDSAEPTPDVDSATVISRDWYADTPAQSGDVSDLERFADGVYVDVANPDAAGVTVSNDIVYYEAGRDFTYGEGTEADAHTAEEAAAHTVLTITQPGTYILSGTLERGQIAVDLGEDAKEDPNAVVTLVLNGVDVTCTVAPAVIFYNVYECGSDDADSAAKDVDTSAAGANVYLPDGSINHVRGSYVARIYKSVVLSDDGKEVIDSKKLHKYDGAFYSKMSMNINGGAENSGVLNIEAENEGLDTELHLTINGGEIKINSGNDGINTNEDGVSVTTMNGGKLDITVNGATGEGDGIDSNGWLVINGGIVYANACGDSMDAGIDSDLGIYLNGGTVMASGNMLDRIAGGKATYVVFSFNQSVKAGENVYLKDTDGNLRLHHYGDNSYRYLLLTCDDLSAGDYTLWVDDVQMAHSGTVTGGMDFGGFGGGRFDGQMPEGTEVPEGFDPSQMQRPEGTEMPEGFDPSQMQRPEGTEMPEGFDFSQMQRPEGTEMPEGFDPSQMQMPEGMEMPEDFDFSQMGGMTPPEGMELPEGGMDFGGRGQGGADGAAAEQNAVLTVAEGGNQFGGISAYQSA